MITILISLGVLAGLCVWLAGRRDAAQDPRLTVGLLGLLVVAPLLAGLPGLAVLPAAGGAERAENNGFSWGWILSGIWLIGMLAGLLRLGVAMREQARWRGRSVPMGWRDGVELRVLPGLAGPVAVGVLRPVIYLPEQQVAWPDEVREAVLKHEMCHHARRDPLWHLLAAVACAVHWFNPLVRWVARRFAMQCEFACDAAVLESGVGVRRYVDVLCDLAWSGAPPVAAVAMSRKGALEARVRRMGGEPKRLSRGVVVVLAVLTFSSGVALCLLRPAEPVAPAMTDEVETRLSADPFPGNP
jgi:beta-lactamase regulating signal transducer with metallopeptidase domain